MPTSYEGTEEEKSALDLQIKLTRAANTFQNRMRPFLDQHGLTGSQFGTLEALYHLGPLQHNEIAEKNLRRKANITHVVDNLERDGLVRREPSEEDRRVVKVHLTEKGEKLISELFPDFVDYLTETLSVLSMEERKQLSGLLKKLGLRLRQ